MNITVCDELKENIMVLPVVPDKLGDINYSTKNEVFESLNGDICIIGNNELKTFKIESIFPVFKSYPFIKLDANFNGWEYHKFFTKNVNKPLRLVITTDTGKSILNMLATYKYVLKTIKSNGNLAYSLEFTEFFNDKEQSTKEEQL